MAKDNLFLGMARGSVGDVTLYRANGQQLSRARNRHPSNPNSTKQAIQRAVSASVARLYSLTRALTDHSFQGRRVGQENQRAFTKRNMAILRSLVLTALNDNLADTATDARISAPGLSVAVPFVGAQMSSGTYAQQLFSFDAAVHGYKLPAPASAEETVAEYAARLGLVAGDIYTFVAIGVDSESVSPLYSLNISDAYASVYQPTFGYVQLMVKSDLSADITAITGKTFADLFSQAGGTTDITYLALTDDVSIDDINTTGSDHGCITCIRSRWDRDLRSDSFLMPATSEMSYGLTPANLLAAWRDKLAIDDVELILEGKNFGTQSGGAKLPLLYQRVTNQDAVDYGFYVPAFNTSVIPAQQDKFVVPYVEVTGGQETELYFVRFENNTTPVLDAIGNMVGGDLSRPAETVSEITDLFSSTVGVTVSTVRAGYAASSDLSVVAQILKDYYLQYGE